MYNHVERAGIGENQAHNKGDDSQDKCKDDSVGQDFIHAHIQCSGNFSQCFSHKCSPLLFLLFAAKALVVKRKTMIAGDSFYFMMQQVRLDIRRLAAKK